MSSQDGFDNLLTAVGFGKWQIPSLLVTVLAMSQFSVQLLGSPLLSAPLPFRCFADPAEYINSSNISMEGSSAYYNSECLSPSNTSTTEPLEINVTNLYPAQHITNILSCPVVEYDRSTFTSTIISQWDLVCERAALRPIFQTLFTLGGILGSLVGGYVGDRWGRKRAVQIGCIVNILVVAGMFFTPLYAVVMILRLVAGCTVMGMLVPAWSLVLESTPAKLRSRVGMLLGLPFSASTMGMALLGYFIRTWKYLLLACASPVLILLPLSFITDESPRWLLQKGHADEASSILQKALRVNNVRLSTPLNITIDKLIQTIDDEAESAEERVSLITPHPGGPETGVLLPALSRHANHYPGDSCHLVPAELPLPGSGINANNFTSTDPFLYLALSGVMEGSAILIITPLTTKIGRRIMVWAGLALGGLLLLLELLVPFKYYWAKWVLVMVGFLLVAGSYQVNYMYAPELFPTEARARGFAFVTVMGSIGFSCAPLITDVLSQHSSWAVGVTFGSSGILGGLLVPLLPETRNTPLPETLQDVEDRRNATISKAKRKKKERKKNGRDSMRSEQYYIDDEELGTELSETSTVRENSTVISNSDFPSISAGVRQ
ncbi:LOW QUALITY PROTEIN: solute carrier family 22 member 20-like [Macrobrachium rosenbergii]|uniref:LOW QUALITY PROTEIN: solute carrier family 22 member 20-like n=1 Tax=Macrobrachium rosenbergii TaxID=79674 RepID=UPI0034D6B47F